MINAFEGGAAQNLPLQPARKDQDPVSGTRETGVKLENHKAIATWLSARREGNNPNTGKLLETAVRAVYEDTFRDSGLPQMEILKFNKLINNVAGMLNGELSKMEAEQARGAVIPDLYDPGTLAARTVNLFSEAQARDDKATKLARPRRDASANLS